MRFKNYFKKEWKEFLASFKLKTKFIYVILLDVLCITATFILGLIYSLLLNNLITPLDGLDLTNLATMGAEGLQQYILLKNTMYGFLIYTALLLIFVLIVYSLFQGLIWNLILKKKFTLKYLGKFSLLNLIWVLFWLIIALVLLIILKKIIIVWVILVYILLLIIFYLTSILYVVFTEKIKIWQAIKDTFNIGKRIHLFIMPYLLVLGLFIVLNLILLVFSLLPQQVYMFVNLIVLLGFIAWFRFYISDVVLKIAKRFKYIR